MQNTRLLELDKSALREEVRDKLSAITDQDARLAASKLEAARLNEVSSGFEAELQECRIQLSAKDKSIEALQHRLQASLQHHHLKYLSRKLGSNQQCICFLLLSFSEGFLVGELLLLYLCLSRPQPCLAAVPCKVCGSCGKRLQTRQQ